MIRGFKNISKIPVAMLLFIIIPVVSMGKDFWEKKSFTVNVTESVRINNSTKIKQYVMSYSGGSLKLQITSPKVNKGEIYTFKAGSKTIYYPSLKQTVTQKLQEDEANILSVFNKLGSLTSKKTQTRNGDTFTFSNSTLISIKSKGYTVNFSNYTKSGEYTYPARITVKNSNSQVTYSLSSFR